MEDASLVRRLLLTILVTGVFLGGYYVGRIPGSPDVISWVRDRLPQPSEAEAETPDPEGGESILTALVDEARKHADRIAAAVNEAEPKVDRPGPKAVQIGGRTYRLGE